MYLAIAIGHCHRPLPSAIAIGHCHPCSLPPCHDCPRALYSVSRYHLARVVPKCHVDCITIITEAETACQKWGGGGGGSAFIKWGVIHIHSE